MLYAFMWCAAYIIRDNIWAKNFKRKPNYPKLTGVITKKYKITMIRIVFRKYFKFLHITSDHLVVIISDRPAPLPTCLCLSVDRIPILDSTNTVTNSSSSSATGTSQNETR